MKCPLYNFGYAPYNYQQPSIFKPTMNYTVDVPINLAKSLEGKYFVGYADNLTFGNGTGEPSGGIKAFVRRGQPETTLVDDEQGKFIFPPCGSWLIFLSNPETPTQTASGRIAFGWWEEPIYPKYY